MFVRAQRVDDEGRPGVLGVEEGRAQGHLRLRVALFRQRDRRPLEIHLVVLAWRERERERDGELSVRLEGPDTSLDYSETSDVCVLERQRSLP